MNRVAESLQKNGGKTCAEIQQGLLRDIEIFTGGEEQSDDIAVLTVGRTA